MADTTLKNCSLDDAKVRAVLDRAFSDTARQIPSVLQHFASSLGDKLLCRPPLLSREVERIRDLYLPVSPKQGRFLYLVARSLRAQRIVEFGTSFGISTIHLAAAIRDNGGGIVVGSEIEPQKVKTARRNIEEAGLGEFVEIREGDARQTLQDPGGTVDMAFLDGYEYLYLTILKALAPSLRQGAVVLADNVFTFRKALKPYISFVQDPGNGFHSITLMLKDGTEYSVRL